MKISFNFCSITNSCIYHKLNSLFRPAKSEADVFCRTPKFENLQFFKCKTIKEASDFAEKNFNILNFDVNNLPDANLMNSIMTKIFNITEGQAKYPPVVSLKRQKGSRFTGECGDIYISIIKNKKIADILIHEIGHYNHQLCSKNYFKMGKLSEIEADGITDLSIYDKFMNDRKSLKLIKKYICPYATSSPAEFVACTFEKIINGKQLPPEIYDLYSKYEGPFADIFKRNLSIKQV